MKPARATADERDRQIRAGNILGPLHGIPIGIKDIIDVAGLPTVAGARGARRILPSAMLRWWKSCAPPEP